jgi:peptidoglycan/LPS O-acetylase OafA/YrhL
VIGPPAICAVVLGTPVSRPGVARIFLNPTIADLGKVSFTVYLWQQLATAHNPNVSPLFTLGALACVFALAVVSYKYFELPLMRLGSRLARAVSAAPTSSNAGLPHGGSKTV